MCIRVPKAFLIDILYSGVSFSFVKDNFWGYICRVLILVLNSPYKVMVGPLGFHSSKCLLSGIVDYLLMGESSPSCWVIWVVG